MIWISESFADLVWLAWLVASLSSFLKLLSSSFQQVLKFLEVYSEGCFLTIYFLF